MAKTTRTILYLGKTAACPTGVPSQMGCVWYQKNRYDIYIYIYNIYKDMHNMYIIRVFEVQFAAYILKSSCLGERCT